MSVVLGDVRSGASSTTAVLANPVLRPDGDGQGGPAVDRSPRHSVCASPPVRRERQADGRIRYWAYISGLGTYIRVVTLADGETVHNAFKDNDFIE